MHIEAGEAALLIVVCVLMFWKINEDEDEDEEDV